MTDSDGGLLIFEVYDSGDVMITDGTASRAYLATEARQEEFARLYAAARRQVAVIRGQAPAEHGPHGHMTEFPAGHRFTDSDGNERVKTRWGFNAFTTAEGARRSAGRLGQRGAEWFIWRLADGSFDYSAVPEPKGQGHPAELVETFTIGRPEADGQVTP
jgi:hypothetical protein